MTIASELCKWKNHLLKIIVEILTAQIFKNKNSKILDAKVHPWSESSL